MHHWTARFLLVLSLVGIFAPAALAMATPDPHACCVRKTMHCQASHQAQFQAPGCCGHDCCRSLTVSQFAEHSSAMFHATSQVTTSLILDVRTLPPTDKLDASHSGRAPPVFL
jgi:hypothetical protein